MVEGANTVTLGRRALHQGLHPMPALVVRTTCSSSNDNYRTNAGSLLPYAALGLVTGVSLTVQCDAPVKEDSAREAVLARRRENVRRLLHRKHWECH